MTEPAAVMPAPETIRALLEDYFAAWGGTDESRIMEFFADAMSLRVPMGVLDGRTAIQENFVRPVIAAFPGNRHIIQSVVHDLNRVAVQWELQAVHTGPFAGVEPSGKHVSVHGCSFYEYDVTTRRFSAGAIYFDVNTLMTQISA